VHNVKNNL